jgi:hypothetical protein
METTGKKGYHSPELFVYGNLPEITKSAGDSGMNDGGTMTGMTKTS